MTATGGIKRYNVVQISGRYYVNDPDTMTVSRCLTGQAFAEWASRNLNSGKIARDDLDWIEL